MAEIVNLNRYRKKRERDAESRQAVVNRERFGRTKGEAEKSRREADKVSRDLDDKRLE